MPFLVGSKTRKCLQDKWVSFQHKFGQLVCGTFSHLVRWIWAGLLVKVTGSQWGNLPLVPSPLPGLKGEKILRTKVCLVCSTLSRVRCPRKPGIKSASLGGELLPHFHEKKAFMAKNEGSPLDNGAANSDQSCYKL